MKTIFEKQLIGVNSDAITKEINNFETAIADLNIISELWEDYFGEPLTPDFIEQFLNSYTISDLIKSHYCLTRDNELSRLTIAGQYKLESLIASTVIPPFEQLKTEVINFKIWVKNNRFAEKISDILPEISTDEGFVLPYSLKEAIEARHTFFTETQQENNALALVTEICNSMNKLNELGANITTRDLPNILQENIATVHTGITFGELKSGSGKANYSVPKLVPYWGAFLKPANSILHLVSQNHIPE